MNDYIVYILVMAGVTYLIRMIPLALVKRKINSTFVNSFIYYVPYAVLAAMTIPSVFYSTSAAVSAVGLISAAVGFAVAVVVAYFGKSLLTVALSACGAVLVTELAAKLF